MMLHQDAAGLVRDIPRLIERNFALDAVLLYLRFEEQLYSSVPGGLDSATLEAMQSTLRAASEPNSETDSELPEGYSHLSLVFGMASVGTLAWKPPTLSREVAASIASQVAIAISRAHAIEASTRLEAARSADRLRTALIDSLTHELRTPLTAIRAAASTLADTGLDGRSLDSETRAELASIVDEESSRLDALIGEAMEIAEIESDGIRVKPEPLHVRTFLEQAAQASRDQLATRIVTITVQDLDDPVWFDPHVIGRALRHLLENAARYTPANSRIHLGSRRIQERLEFVVEDDGAGIDAYDLPMIFEKFYRGRRRNSTAKGSGMGLAIARALLTAHNGYIDAESIPGQGTTFRLWIPLVEKAPSTAPQDSGTSTAAQSVR
jgi:two-component system sensor histidine kinase KdpD